MANDAIRLFNYYRRYRWRAQDFTDLQTALVDSARGPFEGTFGASVLDGFEHESSVGLEVEVSAGIAVGPSGNLLVLNEASEVEFATPVGNPARSLVVVRPKIVESDFITNPTVPFSSVPLVQEQQAEVLVINGTPAADPQYPSLGANDVILFGVRLATGASSFLETDLDFEIRDIPGKNSNFQNNQAKYDDRCRPFKASNKILGIKPSQTFGSRPKQFIFVSGTIAAIFPKDSGGSFVEADSFYNLETGAVTGADEATADFAPTVPSAGNFIPVTISLAPDNTISVKYGIQGTFAQCLDGITNQRTASAGGIANPGSVYRLAYAIVGSANGTTLNSLDFYDARSSFNFRGIDNAKAYPNVFLSQLGNGDVTSLSDAIAALPAAGGVICVMDSVDIGATASFPANTKIIGRAKNAAIRVNAGGCLMFAEPRCTIQDLEISCTGALNMVGVRGGDLFSVEDCRFTGPSGSAFVGVRVEANGTNIKGSEFNHVVAPASGTGIEYAAGYAENTEANNIFTT